MHLIPGQDLAQVGIGLFCLGDPMKIKNLLVLVLALSLLSACTRSKRHGPAASPKSNPKATPAYQDPNIQPNQRNTTISKNPYADFTEREKTIESIEQLLRDMSCQITDTNLACHIPDNQSKSNDLAKLLDTYNQVLSLQINSGMLPQDKQTAYQTRQAPITGYIGELRYNGIRLYSRDETEVYLATQRLEALEIRFVQDNNDKTRDGISDGKWRMAVPSTLLAYKTPTQVLKEINYYLDTIEWFLSIYSGSKHLPSTQHSGYLQKIAQLEELAARIQKIGSKN